MRYELVKKLFKDDGKIMGDFEIADDAWEDILGMKPCCAGTVRTKHESDLFVDRIGLAPENVDNSIPKIGEDDGKD